MTTDTVVCGPGQYKAEYFADQTLSGTPAAVQCENAPLAHNWGSLGPLALGGITDRFSARWSGDFNFGSGGLYRFTAAADDGVRVWVDGDLVIDQWQVQAASEFLALKSLSAGPHTVKVEYFENDGQALARLLWSANCAANQFAAEYFAGVSPSGGPALIACEGGIDHDWGTSGPGAPLGGDQFSARWLGMFDFTAGDYVFSAGADDGIRVWVDDQLVFDGWLEQAATPYRAVVPMTAGAHVVRMDYYEQAGLALAKLFWQKQTPCPSGQFCVEYFAGTSLIPPAKYATSEAAISHDWGTGGPGNGLGNDYFSARWEGSFPLEAATYTFVARADDGLRLWVDGQLLIDQWKTQAPTEYRATKALTAGSHTVRVEYFENTGGAVAQVSWGKEVARVERIVDDTSSGFTKGGKTWQQDTRGYGGHQWWTYVYGNSVDCWSEWRADLDGGTYEVFVYVPYYNATTTSAKYTVYHAGGQTVVSISQNSYSNAWVSLGTYTFAATSGAPRVRLTDATGETINSRKIAFDAVKFTPR